MCGGKETENVASSAFPWCSLPASDLRFSLVSHGRRRKENDRRQVKTENSRLEVLCKRAESRAPSSSQDTQLLRNRFQSDDLEYIHKATLTMLCLTKEEKKVMF